LNKIILTLILLLMASPAFAVTTLTKTVCIPSGCDYTSLESALNGNEKNLVTSDQTFNVVISGAWTTPDTTAVIAHNYTTDATHRVNIYTTGDARHDGRAASVSGRNNYRLMLSATTLPAGGGAIKVDSQYFILDGLEVLNWKTSDSDYATGLLIRNVNNIVKNNIVHDSSGNCASIGIWFDSSNADSTSAIINNVVYNLVSNNYCKYGIWLQYSRSRLVANNTVYNIKRNVSVCNAYGIYMAGDRLFNNISARNSQADYFGVFTSTASNASSDTSSPDSVFRSVTLTFANTVTGDFNLAATDTSAIGNAISLEATFTTDIAGTTRTVPWDIGAFKYIAQVVTSFGSVLNDSVWNDTVFK
jgi:hypothetical protein